ncbi:hypothetical protein BDM02DRAFT_3190661 [Thelephora ganbajun]|uniref:Uncharacterized protein n=1 Tax=Thelephora ganbajun TaxID=370292 RepID=A0ACB6Z4E1_THEGA|nr:hypothetical protein BDM02DRAFT_3190661 [Thelephora ganbajun]
MDTSLAHHKPRRLDTSSSSSDCLPSVIALSPSGDHLAVGCSNGDICIWKLPLGEDTTATHRVSIHDLQGVGISSATWVSDTLVTFGRQNGLVAVVKLDYVKESLSIMNLEADDSLQPIQFISYNTQLMLMATVTANSISVWEWQEPQWTLWKKIRTFSAHNAPAVSRIEENPVRITSLHWLREYKGVKAPLLVSFLYHGVKIIDTTTEQTVYTLPIRTDVGSLSLSKDETMVATNNMHNGFTLYSLPYGTPMGHFTEHNLHPTATSNFLNSDRLLVYPSGAGALKLGDILSKSSLASVGGTNCDQSRILAAEARSLEGYNDCPIFVTLAQNTRLTQARHVTVWECFGEADMVLLEMQRNHRFFSMVASCVAITGIIATWYLTSRGANAFGVL